MILSENMPKQERGPEGRDQSSLSRVRIENADSIIPEYFRDSEGLRCMEEVKKWLVDVVSQGYVTSKDSLRLPPDFQEYAYMFSGSAHSIDFGRMLRDGGINKIQCVIGEPDPAKLAAPADKGRCAVLAVGFLHDQELKLVRIFEIRTDGKVIRIRDEMPDVHRSTNKPPR